MTEVSKFLRDFVDREVVCCVSKLIHDFRTLTPSDEQVIALWSAEPDYEAAAQDSGWQIRHDLTGFYSCSDEEADAEDVDNPSVGFDGRPHFATVAEAARACCEANDIDADEYRPEVYEHWIVGDFLADRLAAQGERIDKDFHGLTIWARTTTGQAIYLDDVIKRIYDAFRKAEGWAMIKHTPGPAEIEANTRLIAAAPDLLAVLEEVRNNLFDTDYSRSSLERLRAIVPAAIAKARGEESASEPLAGRRVLDEPSRLQQEIKRLRSALDEIAYLRAAEERTEQ